MNWKNCKDSEPAHFMENKYIEWYRIQILKTAGIHNVITEQKF